MSSPMSSPGTTKATGVLTTPPSTSSVASSDSLTSISVTTSLNTSTTSDSDVLTSPSATRSPDTPIPSSSPPPTLIITSYEPTSSTTSGALPPTSSTISMLPTANSSSVITPGTYSPTVTIVVSSPPITSQELPRVSNDVFTSSYLTTKYWSSTLFGGSMTTFSTIIETGVLSTNKPRDDNGFSHNTGAIIGVALAGTFSLTMAVVIFFFACQKYKKRHTRYQGSNGEVRNFSRDSWYPPLEGDDDEYYSEGGRPVFTTYTPNTNHTDPEEGMGSAPGATNMEGKASPLMQGPRRQVVIGNTGFHETQGPRTKGRSATSISNLALVEETLPHEGLPRTIISMSNTYTNTCSSKTHAGESHSALSLNTGSSTHENATASMSSGHRFPIKAIHDGVLGVENLPVSHISHSQKLVGGQESDESNFRGFLGRFRRDRDTLPTVIIHGASATSLYEEPQTASDITPHFLGSPSSFPPKHDSRRALPISLNPTQPMELWPAATLPPSPTASEHSRTLEGLLTPHLEMWLASSEGSSLASLRDNVDYSRPISGLIRNRVHSTMTFQTEDTAFKDTP
ncbi:hypothetical protein BDZ94DRAFT_877337 [Collybia nuda]|uniref:Uncharacterized protein n=1 Tax=Collybia nuda TaxID=64659 RepID=A0A9P6CCN3_9AGAR|nr:hypothetical protein BDZ94DRAFT_877337 [Collybia nuda]